MRSDDISIGFPQVELVYSASGTLALERASSESCEPRAPAHDGANPEARSRHIQAGFHIVSHELRSSKCSEGSEPGDDYFYSTVGYLGAEDGPCATMA